MNLISVVVFGGVVVVATVVKATSYPANKTTDRAKKITAENNLNKAPKRNDISMKINAIPPRIAKSPASKIGVLVHLHYVFVNYGVK